MRKFLPLLEKETRISAEKLSKTISNLQRTKNFIEYTVDDIIKNDTHCWNNVCYSFDFSKFLNWHQEISFHILGKLIRELGENQYTPESDELLNLLDKIVKEDFDSATLGGCIILKSDLRIWVIKEYRDKNNNYSNEKWDDFVMQNPCVRGIKIPHKLKIALLREKKLKK